MWKEDKFLYELKKDPNDKKKEEAKSPERKPDPVSASPSVQSKPKVEIKENHIPPKQAQTVNDDDKIIELNTDHMKAYEEVESEKKQTKNGPNINNLFNQFGQQF